MQSKNQHIHNQDAQKSSINIMSQALPFLWCLLLCSLVTFSSAGYTDGEVFCFTHLNENECSGNTPVIYDTVNAGVIDSNSEVFIEFKFRAYDEDESEEWELRRDHLKYGNATLNTNRYTLKMYSPEELDSWKPEGAGQFTGGDDDYPADTYYPTRLGLTFESSWLEKRGAGEHSVVLKISGHADDNEPNDFIITIKFTVENKVLVKGLEEVNLGIFPTHKSENIQTFCVHATGGNRFGLAAYGTMQSDTEDFTLHPSNNSASAVYRVFVSQGTSSQEFIPITNTSNVSETFTGSPYSECGHDNMTLKVKLTTSFEELSQFPADNYKDTLTIFVKAQ